MARWAKASATSRNALWTVFSYWATAMSRCTWVVFRPDQVRASKMGIATWGAKRQVPVPASNRPNSSSLAVPSVVVREIRGKKAARAAPMLAWEIDFFGRIRSLKDRALEEYLATEQARRSAQTLLVGSVASAYLALGADREHLALAEKTLENQRASYALVQQLTDAGIVSELDLRRAQTTVEAARAEIARYTQLVAQDVNALTLLVGAPVPQTLLPGDLHSVTCPYPRRSCPATCTA